MITIRKLLPSDQIQLQEIFNDISKEDNNFFHPHSFNMETVLKITAPDIQDVYIAAFGASGNILAYGMLRGFDEGFKIPSLGIYVHSKYRGMKIGNLLMNNLHQIAKDRGALEVRLTVDKSNLAAQNLYISLGYRFEETERRLVGYLNLDGRKK